MFPSASVTVSALLAACASLVSAATGPMLNTPGALIACQPVQLTWSGGVAPYYISAIPGNQPSGTPLEQIGTFKTQSTSWTVNLAAGTFVTLEITDSAGAINWASALTVQPGSCTKAKTPKAANKVLGTTAVEAAGSDVTTTAKSTSAKAHKTTSGAHASAASKAKSSASAAASGASNGTATSAVHTGTSAVTTGAARLSATASSVTAKVSATSATNASVAAATSGAASGAKALVHGRAVLAGLVGLAGMAVFCLV